MAVLPKKLGRLGLVSSPLIRGKLLLALNHVDESNKKSVN